MFELIQRHRERLLRELRATEEALADLTNASARYKADRIRIAAQLELINKMRSDIEKSAHSVAASVDATKPSESRFYRALVEAVRAFCATFKQQLTAGEA